MKQVTITTGKATIVVFDLPIGSQIESAIFINNFGRYIRFWSKGKDYLIDLPEEGSFDHAGHAYQLTEEDWKGIVDEEEESDIEDHRFAISYSDYCDLQRAFATATESGLSLLKANGVVLENPYGVSKDYVINNSSARTYEEKLKEADLWREAQEQVLENPHIFIKT